MCGICGYILKKPVENVYKDVDLLLGELRKRGPDDEGASLIARKDKKSISYSTERTVSPLDRECRSIYDKAGILPHDVALFHTRYSIIDLSSKGHQPFISSDGNITGVFNGEIYNYLELREELSSCEVDLKTNSDTEVLIEGYNLWGESLWARMNGFWAFCLYDRKENIVILSRDRIGVAPLYYCENEDGLFFSSYIETLLSICGGEKTVDPDVVLGFAQTGIKDHDNKTFYKHIKTIPSASFIKIKKDAHSLSNSAVRKYWSKPLSRMTETDISLDEAVKEFRDIFFRSVELRLRADVKIAFELSGGLDSSSVVAAAAEMTEGRITTFTAKIKGADEEPYAASMLENYDLDYNVVSNIENKFTEDYGRFSLLMEEPYDNPNDYTHNMMLKGIKDKGVDVIVTGAGGDEVFAGYEASFWPKAYSELKAKGKRDFFRADWYEFCRRFKTLESTAHMIKHYSLYPFKGLLRRRDKTVIEDMPGTTALSCQKRYRSLSFHESTLYHFDVALIPYYMRSSDHFTMGIPIEHRFPFLDYRMVEFGLKLPAVYLFRNGWTKYILRKAMEPYLPEKILWRRKKMGFTFPYKKYFKSNSPVFKPLLEELGRRDPVMKRFGDYEDLCKRSPVLLWRLLSIAIWSEHNFR